MDIEKKIPLQLQKEGYGFVPLEPCSKKPMEDGWTKKPYSFTDIQKWIDEGGNYGVMGGYGGLIIIDADKPEIADIVNNKFPKTLTVRTPKKGYHFDYICKDIPNKIVLQRPYPEWLKLKIKNKTATKEERDQFHFGEIISFGAQAVGPGSIHPETKTAYQVVNDIEIATISRELIYSEFVEYIALDDLQIDPEIEISDISIVDVLNKAGVQLRRVGDQLVCGHPVHGSTNDNNFVVHPDKNVFRCFRCNSGGGPLFCIAVIEGVIECSEAKPGGLKGDKFIETCRIAEEKYGFKIKNNNKKLPQGEVLTRLCEEHIETYFMDQQGEPMVVLPIKDHLETCPAKSTRLRNWLAGVFRERNQHPPNSDALKQAQIQVEVKCSQAHQAVLFNRVGWEEEAIYYDLTSPDWRGVRITKDGWDITALPPVFRRYKHQVAQVIPTADGSPDGVLRFCNIRKEDHCLFMVTVATLFIEGFPHVMPYLDGRQGEGKTFASKSVKLLVDPSMALVMSTPKNLEQAQMIGEKHWLTVFENISHIADWFSDFLCRGITGEGDMKRSLYTDDDEFIRAYRRCFLMNGIGTYAERPDLLDRSVIFKIPKLDEHRSENEIITERNRMLPGVLGGFFTVISKAMSIVDQIKGHEQFRMADFAKWGAALAGPLGYSQDEFFKKYQESIDSKWEEAADVNTLHGRIVELMQSGEDWEGTYTELLEAVNPQLEKNLPDSPKKLSCELKRITPLLWTSGIRWRSRDGREPGTGRKLILIGKVDK